MVRAIENVEVACGMPMMGKGEIVEDIAPASMRSSSASPSVFAPVLHRSTSRA